MLGRTRNMHCGVVLGVALASAGAWAQVSQITAAMLLPDMRVENFDAVPTGPILGSAPAFAALGLSNVTIQGTWTVGGDTLSSGVSGNTLVFASSVLSNNPLGGPCDNSGAGGGFKFQLAAPVTQFGVTIVDQAGMTMTVEVYSGGILRGSVAYMPGSSFPLPPGYFQSAVPIDEFRIFTPGANGGWGIDNLTIAGYQGPLCRLNGPAGGATVSSDVTIDYDLDHAQMMAVSASFDWSTDAGATFNPCTAAPGSMNPVVGVATPSLGRTFVWDSLADTVGRTMLTPTTLRITVSDGMQMATCSVDVDVDNVAPAPTCTLTLLDTPPVRRYAHFELTGSSINDPVYDVTIEYSSDAGATWFAATPGTGVNPIIGIPNFSVVSFEWDSRTDGVALGSPESLVVRAVTSDATSLLTGSCATPSFIVDNVMLCFTVCGDCDEDLVAPTILDALVAARIGGGLLVPSSPLHAACCDASGDLMVNVIDALMIAQKAAGLGVVLGCQ